MDDKTILRKPHNADNPYVVITKNIFEDDGISWRAKGMMGYLLSRPDDWTIIIGDLVKRAPEGRGVVRSTLRELEQHGYLLKRTLRDEHGRWAGTEMIVLEHPAPPEQRTYRQAKGKEPQTDPPHTENPHTVGPHTEECPLLSIDGLPSIDLTKEEPPAADSPPAGCVGIIREPLTYDGGPITVQLEIVADEESFYLEGETSTKPAVPRTAGEHKAGIQRALETYAATGGNAGVADPTKEVDEWMDRPVKEWCKLSGKSYKDMSIPTRIKLAGIFYKVGTITDSDAAQVAEAIGNFKAEHSWWKYEFEWPSDGFCDRLGMMLVPDAQPEPGETLVSVQPTEPAWLGGST